VRAMNCRHTRLCDARSRAVGKHCCCRNLGYTGSVPKEAGHIDKPEPRWQVWAKILAMIQIAISLSIVILLISHTSVCYGGRSP
jgi:hypothetical protein